VGPTAGPGTWWQILSGFRFQAYPYPVRPLRTETIAQTVPVFVRGCTQFIVEYAGDYLQQEPTTGSVLGTAFSTTPSTDGVVDFVVVRSAGLPASAPGQRRIRWYGAPRNVYTDDDRPGQPVVFGSRSPDFMRDVVPLRDVLLAQKVTPPADFFEREMDSRLKNVADYGALAVPSGSRPNGSTPFVSPLLGTDPNEYVAAWGPEQLAKGSPIRPKMLRITLVVDDAAGRMTEGQTFEYVFTLP
jgi:hypothetical protein